MQVHVLFFAQASDLAGQAQEALDFPEGSTVADLRSRLARVHPELDELLGRSRIAVDQEFRDDTHPLSEGAEVAVIPPVSGG